MCSLRGTDWILYRIDVKLIPQIFLCHFWNKSYKLYKHCTERNRASCPVPSTVRTLKIDFSSYIKRKIITRVPDGILMVSLSSFRRKEGLLDFFYPFPSQVAIWRRRKRTKNLLDVEGLWTCYCHHEFQCQSGRRNRVRGSSHNVAKKCVRINQTRANGRHSGS